MITCPACQKMKESIYLRVITLIVVQVYGWMCHQCGQSLNPWQGVPEIAVVYSDYA